MTSIVLSQINTLTSSETLELIGKFKINTVPNILRLDVQAYQIILASILKGSVDAVESAHEDRQLIYSRLLWLLPPLLLRNPKKLVSKRLEAFIQGDLDLCYNGLCSTHDNHFAIQKSPASIQKLAADKVFNGQYSKAMTVYCINHRSLLRNKRGLP